MRRAAPWKGSHGHRGSCSARACRNFPLKSCESEFPTSAISATPDELHTARRQAPRAVSGVQHVLRSAPVLRLWHTLLLRGIAAGDHIGVGDQIIYRGSGCVVGGALETLTRRVRVGRKRLLLGAPAHQKMDQSAADRRTD